ncbi:MAG: MoaD/ThiS family protein [Candidatus Eisenbacteria bacterium]|uniref:MoaD/ThiS family protein n=1 Tax=Eiseniibacteriota bacterium TaxID=2212470 RepID=A0A956RPF2_UNCEI|nr:MoaD/ThiS family protein [Candidatus Eisenbacteria bacterium]
MKAGSLHPAVLVVVDGEACLPERRDRVLSGGETIDLFLPIAGG